MENRVSDEEMEHYMMFPDLYCKNCQSGCGPLCDACLNDEEVQDRYFPRDDNDYGVDDLPTQFERDAADEAFNNEVIERGY